MTLSRYQPYSILIPTQSIFRKQLRLPSLRYFHQQSGNRFPLRQHPSNSSLDRRWNPPFRSPFRTGPCWFCPPEWLRFGPTAHKRWHCRSERNFPASVPRRLCGFPLCRNCPSLLSGRHPADSKVYRFCDAWRIFPPELGLFPAMCG